MTCRDAMRLAVSALRGGVIRTILTVLGLGVGVGAVLAVLTLGESGEDRVEAEIARLGVNKVWVRAKDSSYHIGNTDSERLALVSQAPACAGAYTIAMVRDNGGSALTQISGFDASFSEVHAPKLLQGRMMTPTEFAQGSSVCLVDKAYAERMQEEEKAPGQWITVSNRRFRIVGVIKGMTMQSMTAGSGLVILPLNSFLDTFGGEIAEITLSVQRDQQADVVAKQALQALGQGGYRADTLENEINAAKEIVRIFIMVLICVAIVCMLTGGIGVMNVLLVSIRERKREIGLLKAIGATSAQVGLLFLLEASAYALLGGLLGVLLGSAMIQLFSAWIGLDAKLRLIKAIPVLLSAAVLGLAFGVAPALKAAAMQPVEALRCE